MDSVLSGVCELAEDLGPEWPDDLCGVVLWSVRAECVQSWQWVRAPAPLGVLRLSRGRRQCV